MRHVMAFRRRQPLNDTEIIKNAEREAQAWAEWLKPYIETGIARLIEGRHGEIRVKRYRHTSYTIWVTSRDITITLWGCNVAPRIPAHLQHMGYVVKGREKNLRYGIHIQRH